MNTKHKLKEQFQSASQDDFLLARHSLEYWQNCWMPYFPVSIEYTKDLWVEGPKRGLLVIVDSRIGELEIFGLKRIKFKENRMNEFPSLYLSNTKRSQNIR